MSCDPNICQPLGPEFAQGQLLRITGIFQDDDQNLIDPSTITLKIKLPDGTITTLVYGTDPIVNDAVGNYHYDFLIVQAGQYFRRWIGTGVCQTSEPDVPFYVPSSVIIPVTG